MTSAQVLVAYATRNGATAEIARWIGDDLVASGVRATVRPAGAAGDLTGYDAVVLGSGVYRGRWLPEAARFARRHRRTLAGLPVWLFSSGPLDPSAAQRSLPPVPGAVRVADAVDALDHVTFGGRLIPGARGFIARQIIAQGKGGDFRDRAQIRDWALGSGATVGRMQPTV
jgi:menaquinone-dependent protoporphyrinogen oxidase